MGSGTAPGLRELPTDCDFHFFLSHSQEGGGDQVDSLCQQLEKRGFLCWYDNNMEDLTKEAMAQGVRESSCVILFLSSGVLERPFVQFEISAALEARKKVLLLREGGPRMAADIAKYLQQASL